MIGGRISRGSSRCSTGARSSRTSTYSLGEPLTDDPDRDANWRELLEEMKAESRMVKPPTNKMKNIQDAMKDVKTLRSLRSIVNFALQVNKNKNKSEDAEFTDERMEADSSDDDISMPDEQRFDILVGLPYFAGRGSTLFQSNIADQRIFDAITHDFEAQDLHAKNMEKERLEDEKKKSNPVLIKAERLRRANQRYMKYMLQLKLQEESCLQAEKARKHLTSEEVKAKCSKKIFNDLDKISMAYEEKQFMKMNEEIDKRRATRVAQKAVLMEKFGGERKKSKSLDFNSPNDTILSPPVPNRSKSTPHLPLLVPPPFPATAAQPIERKNATDATKENTTGTANTTNNNNLQVPEVPADPPTRNIPNIPKSSSTPQQSFRRSESLKSWASGGHTLPQLVGDLVTERQCQNGWRRKKKRSESIQEEIVKKEQAELESVRKAAEASLEEISPQDEFVSAGGISSPIDGRSPSSNSPTGKATRMKKKKFLHKGVVCHGLVFSKGKRAVQELAEALQKERLAMERCRRREETQQKLEEFLSKSVRKEGTWFEDYTRSQAGRRLII